jgi:hypothetical protein
MEELPSVVPVKTGIQGLLSVSWMPAYDRGHDDLGSPIRDRSPHLTDSVRQLKSKFLQLIRITPKTSASPIQ